MKLLSIIVLKHIDTDVKPILLSTNYYLDDIFFLKRGPIEEVCIFVSRLVVQNSKRGELKSVKHNEFLCHCRVAGNGLAVAAVCDAEFPAKKVFNMLKNVTILFNTEVPEFRWKDITQDIQITLSGLADTLAKEEKTEEIKKELDEVRVIMQDNIDKILDRDLETLLQQTDDLSAGTKIMVKQSKDLNSNCLDCVIL